jgi:hypothetical protein
VSCHILTTLTSANLSNTALKGPEIYQEGKNRLDVAIREYDQAVMHLTAQVVASMHPPDER